MDLGQGSATAMALIAAEELGVPLERVAADAGDTATSPDAGPTVGSRVTFFVGNAVRKRPPPSASGPGHGSGLLDRPAGDLELCDG